MLSVHVLGLLYVCTYTFDPLGQCLIVAVENMTYMTLYTAALAELQTNAQVSHTIARSDCVPGRAFFP